MLFVRLCHAGNLIEWSFSFPNFIKSGDDKTALLTALEVIVNTLVI